MAIGNSPYMNSPFAASGMLGGFYAGQDRGYETSKMDDAKRLRDLEYLIQQNKYDESVKDSPLLQTRREVEIADAPNKIATSADSLSDIRSGRPQRDRLVKTETQEHTLAEKKKAQAILDEGDWLLKWRDIAENPTLASGSALEQHMKTKPPGVNLPDKSASASPYNKEWVAAKTGRFIMDRETLQAIAREEPKLTNAKEIASAHDATSTTNARISAAAQMYGADQRAANAKPVAQSEQSLSIVLNAARTGDFTKVSSADVAIAKQKAVEVANAKRGPAAQTTTDLIAALQAQAEAAAAEGNYEKAAKLAKARSDAQDSALTPEYRDLFRVAEKKAKENEIKASGGTTTSTTTTPSVADKRPVVSVKEGKNGVKWNFHGGDPTDKANYSEAK